jgi:hypothetical protein
MKYPELLDEQMYNRLWQELVAAHPASSREYFDLHRKRYFELFNNMAYYLQEKMSPLVLEIGVSGFLPLYKQIFPDITLVTVDRPVEMGGVDASFCIGNCKAERHYSIDLNVDRLSKDRGALALGTFDFVVCAEVIEHLVVNPVEFISSLIGLLDSEGYLYLTTPNFFSYHNLQKIRQRVNPQAVFPGHAKDRHCSHHFREYEMNELQCFVREAGGRIVNAYFSDCWEEDWLVKGPLSEHPEQRANLVLIAARQESKENNAETVHCNEQAANVQTAPGMQMPDELAELKNALALADKEVARLRELVAGYERGRFIRFMKRLKAVRRRGVIG